MFRYLTVGLLLLISSSVLAQEGTPSPYSFYGIGSIKFRGTTESRSMGGVGVFSDSIHVNLQNPATYSELGLVTFAIGASNQVSTLSTDSGSQTNSATSLDYFALGIPMGKLGMGFGILPYSSVGYHFYSEIEGGLTEYGGKGGLNKTYLSLAYQITPEFSLGIDGNYNFGKIHAETTSQKSDLEYGTRTQNTSEIRGFNLNFGAVYKKMITNKLELTGSATYTPGADLTSENRRKVGTVSIRASGMYVMDERDIDVPDTEFSYPSQFTVGAALSQPKHWSVGMEFSRQQTSSLTGRAFVEEKVTYKDASKFRVGGYYIPNYNSFGDYYKRVVYRAGMRFEETGMSFEGNDINELGISFGLGMPVGRLFSNINVGFELGQRGTKKHGLVKENFFNAMLSFSLNDRWFEKRLYD